MSDCNSMFERARLKRASDLFWPKVDVRSPNECWPWRACYFPTGYGKFSSGPNFGISPRASRAAWHLTFGDPGDKDVCHSCDNPACCNPNHLWLGYDIDNVRDKFSKGRQANVRGELNPRSKLREADVLSIRRDTRKPTAIGRQYGVSATVIAQIKSRKLWRYLKGPSVAE